jgi:hypothetical protein
MKHELERRAMCIGFGEKDGSEETTGKTITSVVNNIKM